MEMTLTAAPQITQETAVDLLVTGLLDITFVRKADDREPIPKPEIEDEIANAFFLHGGKRFLGEYTINVGQIEPNLVVKPRMNLMAHSPGRRSIGFIFGSMKKRGILHPARRYGLVPPESVDVDELDEYLRTGNCRPSNVAKIRPDVVIVQEQLPAPIEVPASSAVDSESNDLLAQAYLSAMQHKQRFEAAGKACVEVEEQIARLEAKLSTRTDVETIVRERLASRIKDL